MIDSSWHKARKLNFLMKLCNVHLHLAGEIKSKFYKRNLSTEEFGLSGQATHILRSAENAHVGICRCRKESILEILYAKEVIRYFTLH